LRMVFTFLLDPSHDSDSRQVQYLTMFTLLLEATPEHAHQNLRLVSTFFALMSLLNLARHTNVQQLIVGIFKIQWEYADCETKLEMTSAIIDQLVRVRVVSLSPQTIDSIVELLLCICTTTSGM
jgi:hypothetical protein